MTDGTPPPHIDATLLEEDATDLYDHAPCGYMSTLGDGAIVKVNRTFLQWTGYEDADLLSGSRFHELLATGSRILFETHVAPLLRMQGFVREVAFDMLRRDGSRLPVLINASLREGTDIIRVTIFDATDRRRYERELLLARQRAEQEAASKGRLVAMLSHDIRTPLNAVVTAAALLDKSNLSPAQRRYIEIVRAAADRATALVGSVLDLSQLESGQAALRERAVDLRRLAHDVLAAVRLTADEKGLELHVKIDERVPERLMADANKLGQVLGNLLANAVKFTEVGFVSFVAAVREITDRSVTLDIAVSDTGIGIPPERLPHIFDEFVQASDDIAERYGGTGLGLAIARKLLALYGSELQATSTVGQGTTFSFVIELRRPPA